LFRHNQNIKPPDAVAGGPGSTSRAATVDGTHRADVGGMG